MSMTPGQPIQNFRKYSETIKMADIEKFRNEEETIDKYKKRYKERYKEELEKAVERMKRNCNGKNDRHDISIKTS